MNTNKPLIARTTIKGVELLKVGNWNSSSAGPTDVTPEHLTEMIRAYADPEVDRPVLKLGHVDPRFDGTPAAGWVTNLRLANEGNSLVGDLSEIPSRLAAIIPTAFKRRSVEFRFGLKTPAGKLYGAALSGLALLGVTAPAVKGLEDILDVYASTSEATSESEAAVELSGDTVTVPQPTPNTGDAINGSGAEGSANLSATKGAPVAILDSLKEKLGLAADATEADVEAALATSTVTAAPAPAATPETPETPAPAAPAAPVAGAPAPAATAVPAAAPVAAPAALSAGAPATVQVSAVVFAEMQAQLSGLAAESKEMRDVRNLDAALSAGRIAPSERDAWAAELKKNEAPVLAILSALPARFSTVEIGLSDAPAPTAAANEDELERLAAEAGI